MAKEDLFWCLGFSYFTGIGLGKIFPSERKIWLN